MSKIPEHFIDDLLSKVDIVDVVNARVPLKKSGHEFNTCCPFHSEKTPSFTVSPNKQFYHCFGCGAHGNSIGFLMAYENLTFVQSIELLASSIGVEVPREQTKGQNYKQRENQEEQNKILTILQKANQWFLEQLRTHPSKNAAVGYLKLRGLSGQICKTFQIGYAPSHGLIAGIGADEVEKKLMYDAGLLAKNERGELYERFRNRIQFPIHDFSGRVIGFGGRTLVDDKAKYYNSPETKLFHKGKELYGLYQARSQIRKQNMVLVVEGYMDVVALAQFGVDYAVATLGTTTTTDHLRILFRTTSKIICCFDGDKAGVKAAIKAMNEVLSLMRDGREISFMFLPIGEDPDSYIRAHGKDKFEQLLNKSKPLEAFLFAYLRHKAPPKDIAGRAKLTELAKPMLKKLAEGVYFDLMVQKLAEITQMNVETLRKYIKNTPESLPSNRLNISSKSATIESYKIAHKAIALLMEQPGLAKIAPLPSIFFESRHPDIKLLIQVFKICQKQPDIHAGQLAEKLRHTENASERLAQMHLFEILMPKLLDKKNSDDAADADINKQKITSQQEQTKRQVFHDEFVESIKIIKTQLIDNKNTYDSKTIGKAEINAFVDKLKSEKS